MIVAVRNRYISSGSVHTPVRGSIGAVRKLAGFLVSEGIAVNHSRSVDREKADHNLTAFLDWLAQHRGVSERTVSQYRRHIAELLVELGSDPCCYDGVVIRSTILRHLETKPRSHVQHIVSSLRMYLRYLELAGLCTSGLVHAVPTIPTQSLSMLPRYVSEDDIERIIESCDVTTSNGLRDKAILLLLARLGLRGGDIANLRLKDIDWREASVRVVGKSKRQTSLPLPQEVGDALKDYILHARPRVNEEKVFLRNSAPRHLPISGSGVVSSIASRACERAGIKRQGLPAAHLFRHSLATHLVRSGTPLEVVGSLLRHQSPKTTAIYAKVDVPMLCEVVQPWPCAGGSK